MQEKRSDKLQAKMIVIGMKSVEILPTTPQDQVALFKIQADSLKDDLVKGARWLGLTVVDIEFYNLTKPVPSSQEDISQFSGDCNFAYKVTPKGRWVSRQAMSHVSAAIKSRCFADRTGNCSFKRQGDTLSCKLLINAE